MLFGGDFKVEMTCRHYNILPEHLLKGISPQVQHELAEWCLHELFLNDLSDRATEALRKGHFREAVTLQEANRLSIAEQAVNFIKLNTQRIKAMNSQRLKIEIPNDVNSIFHEQGLFEELLEWQPGFYDSCQLTDAQPSQPATIQMTAGQLNEIFLPWLTGEWFFYTGPSDVGCVTDPPVIPSKKRLDELHAWGCWINDLEECYESVPT